MKLIKQEDNILELESPYEELSAIEQSIGIITGAFKVDNFVDKIGAKEEELEKIRIYLRGIVDQNEEYNDMAMNDWDNPRIHFFKTTIKLGADVLPWIINSIKVSIDMAPGDEFHTLTGHDQNYALNLTRELENIGRGL
jgi:hypothetical protein